ncbi:hypothetical protein AGMMS50212_06260 [Spirochaetia bacterium]|nr:hypothetical protein AGMMS50212_06260 [Spirochaetia bacterium]
MKKVKPIILLTFIIGNLYAADLESYEYIDLLLNIVKPSPPAVFDDAVIFTASGAYKKVGIAFSHEDFKKIYWFKKLLVPIDETMEFRENSKIPPEYLRDSNILFYPYTVPQTIKKLEYRLIVDGLWTTDPSNPSKRFDMNFGIDVSCAPLPVFPETKPYGPSDSGKVLFSFRAESGDTVSVAGDFNGWDPFMYELKETQRGQFSFEIPLPAGTWHYVFFHNGKRVLDPANQKKAYAPDGATFNVALVQ